jgi:hypothetical protein
MRQEMNDQIFEKSPQGSLPGAVLSGRGGAFRRWSHLWNPYPYFLHHRIRVTSSKSMVRERK